MTLVEACVTSLPEAVLASRAGSDRLELCRDLPTGGLTPSFDLMSSVRAAVDIQLFAMVRPRAGSFQFTRAEVAVMIREAAHLVTLGVDGFVFGALDGAGHIDRSALDALMGAVGALPVTFHRAFDEVVDPPRALESLVDAGVSRLLTGGGPGRAWDGRDRLRELVGAAAGRLTVVAGGSVREDHVRRLVAETGVTEVHARASAIPGVVEALRGVES